MNNRKLYKYSAFGLVIGSEIELPELLSSDIDTEIKIEFGETPVELQNPIKKGLRFQAAENEFLLHVDNVASFYVKNGDSITIKKKENADDDSVRLFLLGSALGALLMQRDMIPMHGSTVKIDDYCIVITGVSGVGKSTLAAQFFKQDYQILSDDVSAIKLENKQAFIVPSYPQIKLWADAIRKFNDNPGSHRKLRDNIEKFGIKIHKQYYTKPLPVKAVFILNTKNTEGIDFDEVKGIEKFNALRRNTYRFQFVDGLNKQKEHFQTINQIASLIKVYRITRPRKGFNAEELKNIIIEKLK